MGIFDIFKRKRKIDPGLVRATEDYKRNLEKAKREGDVLYSV